MSVNVILTSVLFNNKSTGNHTRVSNNEHFLFSTEFVRLVTRTVKLLDKPLSKFTAKSALENDNRISTYLTISLHTFDNNP